MSPKNLSSYRRRFNFPRGLAFTIALATFLGLGKAQATTYYWDTNGASAGLGSATTPANWNGTAFWNTDSTGGGAGTVTTPTWTGTTNSAILAGTAGTITLNSATVGAGTVTVNTNGYVLTSSAATRGLVATSLILGSNVGLELNTNSGAGGSGTSSVWALGGISFGTGSTLTVSGAASAANGNTVYLTSATTISGGAITLAGSGAGITGFVSTGGLVNLNTVITNNSTTSATQLGASSSGSLTMGAKVTGSAGLMFGGKSGTASGGAGTITLNAANDYTGATSFNAATGALIKLGIDNALPTGTDVTMAASSSNGGILDLNGHNQEIASLTSGVGGGSITNGAGGTGTNTLTISGSASPAAFGLAITDGATAKTAITRYGTGTTILSGANTYTGATAITGGTLTVTGSLGNTAVTLSNTGSTLSSGVNATSSITGTVTANSGTFLTPGGAGTIGTFTLGGLTMNGSSTLNMDISSSTAYDKIVTSGLLTLGSGVETINIAGSVAAGTYTLVSGYTSLSSGSVFTLGSTPSSSFNYSLATGSTSTILTVSALGGSGGNLTWSLGGLAPTSGTDGAGTWTNGAGNFYNTATSASTTWDSTAGNNLTVGSGGAGGTITLGSGVRVGGTLTFATASSPYTIGASGGTNTLTLVGGITSNNSATLNAATVLEASQIWNVTAGTLTANGDISGSSMTLTKTGVGKLVLTSTGNSYSGGTVFGDGIVSVGSDANLGNTSGGLTFGGGTLQTSTGITSARTVAVNSSGGTFDTNGFDSTLIGNITGAGALTKTGSGALTVSGTNTYSGGTALAAGTLNNNGSHTLGGSNVAVSVTGSSTFNNNGTINQTGTGRAVRDNTGGLTLTVSNGSATNSAALMQTADADVIQMAKATSNVTLNNYGTMTSLNASAGGSQVVDFNVVTGSNTVNNFAGATMQASEADAVRPGVNGVVNNAGIIKSTTATGSSSDGIDAQTNSGITITNASNAGSGTGTGTIEGGRHGITGGNVAGTGAYTMSITNNLGGTIKGNNGSGINIDGINGNEVVTVINHGTISGNGVTGDGDGFDVDGLVNLTNTGLIRSINAFSSAEVANSEGLSVGGGTITNSGTIEGLVAPGNTNAVGRGISLLGNDITTGLLAGTREAIYADATVTNQSGGLIRGDSDSGIFVGGPASGFTVTINNNAGAIIQGGGTTNAAIMTGSDNDTINNAGTIDGSSGGKAINMGAGNNTLNVTGALASIKGDINGGTGGINHMTINPGTGNSFTYANTISNFSDVQISSGTVTLESPGMITGNTFVKVGASLIDSGTFAGAGTTLTVENGGVLYVSAKDTPGISTFTTGASLALQGGANVFFDIGGHARGTEYDVIDGLTSLTLGGTFHIGYFNGFTASIGDTFNLIDWTNLGDLTSLASVNFDFAAATPGSGAWNTSDFLKTGNISLIAASASPEPSRMMLLLVGFAGITLRRRRRIPERVSS